MMNNKGSSASLKKAALVITIITLLCKVVGFFKNTALAYFFGTSPVVDAYVMVFSIGNIVFGWMGAFTGNFTPSYKYVVSKEGEECANDYAVNMKNWLIIIILFFSILFEVFAPQIVHLVAIGFHSETYELTLHFWRIYCISFFFSTIHRLYKEYLNCQERFIYAQAPDMLTSALTLAGIVVSAYAGQELLIWGYIVALIVEYFITMRLARKCGFKNYLVLKLDNNILAAIKTVFPVFLADAMTEINVFVDKMFASMLPSGSLSVLEYANILKNIVFDTGLSAIGIIIFPKLSKEWSEGNVEEFNNHLLRGLCLVTVLFIPLIAGLLSVGDYVVAIVFERGAFGPAATEMTYSALAMYAIGLMAMVYRNILNKGFLAMRKTKAVFFVSVINIVVNIIMNALLINVLGYKGLALATSIAAICVSAAYFTAYRRALAMPCINHLYGVFVKSVGAASIMCCIIVLLRQAVFHNVWPIVSFCLLTAIGAAVYFVFMRLLRVEEINFFLDIIPFHICTNGN